MESLFLHNGLAVVAHYRLETEAQRLVTGAAARLFDTGLVLPSGSVLDDAGIARVLDGIGAFLDGAG